MTTNDFKAFAIGGGANVVSQATWDAAAALIASGYAAGIAESAYLNKTWRQSSVIATAVAQLIVDQLGVDVLDDGDVQEITDNLILAIQQSATVTPVRVITDGANFLFTASDGIVGLNRSTGLIALQTGTLPAMAEGQSIALQDLANNLSTNPVKVIPPAGSIAGLADFTCNENRSKYVFTYFGTNLYGVAING